MVGLTLSELKKRNNFSILKEKIEKHGSLPVVKRKAKAIKKDFIEISANEEFLGALDNAGKDPDKAEQILEKFLRKKTLFLPTIDGSNIPSGWLQKTRDYGSIHSGELYIRESREFNKLRSELSNYTSCGTKSITLQIKTKDNRPLTFPGITSVQTCSKKHKADFVFVDAAGKTVLKISHKYGTKSKDFRQWSGIKHFYDYGDVKRFGSYVQTEFKKSILYPKNFACAMRITNDELKRKAIFGFGQMEVDAVFQGHINFRPVTGTPAATTNPPTIADVYEIYSDVLYLTNQDSLKHLPAEYEPILLTLNSVGKGAFGIKNCRAMVYPRHGKIIHRWFENPTEATVVILPPPLLVSHGA